MITKIESLILQLVSLKTEAKKLLMERLPKPSQNTCEETVSQKLQRDYTVHLDSSKEFSIELESPHDVAYQEGDYAAAIEAVDRVDRVQIRPSAV